MRTATEIAAMKPISADSHITEPPDCYKSRIEPKYRDTAPHVVYDKVKGDTYVIEGMPGIISLGTIAAAGQDARKIREHDTRFEELHRGGWDPKARLLDQDKDGVAAEIIYPTVGMMICNHPDFDYKAACFRAYNAWLQEFVAGAPHRLFGVGQTAARSPAEMIEDFRRIKEMGFRGVMLPGEPLVEDYDHPVYDPVWRAAVELDLPVSFHILTAKKNNVGGLHIEQRDRGGKLNTWQALMRSVQDIIGVFIFGGVFHRHPELKLVCVEADAGWVPHYMYRMDHAYKRHRHWLKVNELGKLPSEYFRENVYLTFQDDWIAFQVAELCNPARLMWANDFPHADATWPWSQQLLVEQTGNVAEPVLRGILHENVSALYKLSVH